MGSVAVYRIISYIFGLVPRTPQTTEWKEQDAGNRESLYITRESNKKTKQFQHLDFELGCCLEI